jgi:excisionase family DNA binding protein
MRGAPWLHGPDTAEALRAIHVAGHIWEMSLDLPQRHNDVASVHSPHGCDTMSTGQAADALQVSRRHIQRLAQYGSITGRRVAGRWILDQRSVRIYQQQYTSRRQHDVTI